MSVITKDLGVATAYGYAKSKGYTGTEEEFAELMASYADVAQQAEAAAQDAEDAKDAAVSAKNDAVTAKTAAESAQAAAAGSAQTASTKASEASNSAQTAAGSATSASDSATVASGSASTAQTAAQTATSKASEAASSASAASTAKTGAETARTGAQTAQTAAETAQENAEAAASSVSASAAQIEQNTEEIGAIKNDFAQLSDEMPNKANIDGSYDNMTVGNAKQLVATVGIEDKTPYLFRTSGGSVDIGDRETVNKIVGGTIVNNQKAKEFNSTNYSSESGVTASYSDGIATITSTVSSNGIVASTSISKDHVYYVGMKCMGDVGVNASISTGVSGLSVGNVIVQANVWEGASGIKKAVSDGTTVYIFGRDTTYENLKVKDFQITDLTQDFGKSIADYVYSLETATAGAGVTWLKKHFPKQFDAGYQAYDAGSMQSVSGLTAHKMVGFNQWDEECEVGTINSSNGQNVSATDRIRSKNYMPILNNMTYYVCVPDAVFNNNMLFIALYDANKNFVRASLFNGPNGFSSHMLNPNFLRGAKFLRFWFDSAYGPTYNHDICVNFSWDGEKDGTYEPYKTWSYALDDSVVIRGIPKVDANGNLYYDGDEYLADGTVTHYWKEETYDGSEAWVKDTNLAGYYRFYVRDDSVKTMTDYRGQIINSRGYGTANGYGLAYDPTDNVLVTAYNILGSINWIYIAVKESMNISTVDAFKAWLAQNPVTLVLQLATPTTETAEPYQTPQIVDDWGTEEYVLADGAYPVPVGHDTWYQNNLRAKLEMSPESPDGDGLYVVQQESGENTYVPLASTATIQDILTRLTALENA